MRDVRPDVRPRFWGENVESNTERDNFGYSRADIGMTLTRIILFFTYLNKGTALLIDQSCIDTDMFEICLFALAAAPGSFL